MRWRVPTIFRPKDGKWPHINCTLLETNKIIDDSLMFSEVWSIIYLTLIVLREKGHEKLMVVPVS